MLYQVNIGLDYSDAFNSDYLPTTTADKVKYLIALFNSHGATVENRQLADSETEPTLVANIYAHDKDAAQFERMIYGISGTFAQDCIAWRDSEGNGYLTGARAQVWGGEFDPEYWIEPKK